MCWSSAGLVTLADALLISQHVSLPPSYELQLGSNAVKLEP